MTMDTILSPRRRRLLGAAGSIGLLGACGGAGLAGCSEAGAPPQVSGYTMGTTWRLRLVRPEPAAPRLELLHAAVQSALDEVDHRLSLYRSGSDLLRFNAHQSSTPLALSPQLHDVLSFGQHVARLTDGAFDMSVAPLVDAWGFGPSKGSASRSQPPAPELVSAGRAVLGHDGLQLLDGQRAAVKHRAGYQADLGGIAKGYGVDRAALALQALGVEDYMLEVGGEVRTLGRNGRGQPWQIGIEQPDAVPQRARLVLPLSGRAMATSGDYRQFFEHAGRRYSHEIDPARGEPIAHGLASVTVVADDCMAADALATGLIVLGPQRGMALAQREGIAAHFILRGAKGSLSDASSPAMQALRQAGQAERG
jgi:FAD:protein FMN transferase